MRQFYMMFPDFEIVNTRVHNLSWSHYRMLLRVTDDNARYWHLKEADTQMWSVRTLSRNIGSQYYHRLLQSPHKDAVIKEMQELTAPLAKSCRKYEKSDCGRVSEYEIVVRLQRVGIRESHCYAYQRFSS